MIPKTIHYCWFSRNPKPKLAEKCIRSWKKHCPDYQIIEWNEDNFDISACPLYVRQAYEAKKWAFVTDYVRLKVVYEHGGIYLDTDVEIKKSLDGLLQHDAYFGFEDGKHIATGLGFGAIKRHPVLREMMGDYEDIPFMKEDGTCDLLPCPQRNTNNLIQRGLIQDDSWQILKDNILILPSVYLCPLSFWSGTGKITDETISVHWFSASWEEENNKLDREQRVKQFRKQEWKDYMIHTPNRVLMRMLGSERYEAFKRIIKRG